MTTIYFLDAGRAAPKLKEFINELHRDGINERFFMDDVIETLRYEEIFDDELTNLQTEIEFGHFYQHKLARNRKPTNPPILSSVATLTSLVAKHLHNSLVAQGRYNNSGEFLYEFHSFDGRLIFLREQGSP